MKKFLNHIIDDIRLEELPLLRNWCFVFPTRRAGVHFKKLLGERFYNMAFWAPEVLSIEDFIVKVSGRSVSDDMSLVFELFKVYKRHEPGIIFDNFYSWGQILLSDFDEVDRHLVDTELLYRNLQDLKEIEASFGIGEEAMEAMKQFRNLVGIENKSRLLVEFMNTWNKVSKVHRDFKEHLLEANLAYVGMLYREVCEGLRTHQLDLNYDKVIFGGFNALTKAEEELFDILLNDNKATIYWDADKLYLEDKREEAGVFLRQYATKWTQENSKWITDDMLNEPKEMEVIGVQGSVGQAKAVGNILERKAYAKENTAVVLADEQLLFPVLHAIPKSLKAVNITMGYPLKNTSFFNLAYAVLQLHANKKVTGENKVYFLLSTVLNVLTNPYILAFGDREYRKALNDLRQFKLKVISLEELNETIKHPLFNLVFEAGRKASELLEMLMQLLFRIYQRFSRGASKGNDLEYEFAYHFIKHLNKFKETLMGNNLSPGPELLTRLFKEAFQQLKVPFKGEPLLGLQVMGFLETRSLDFENIIVVGVNEGKLPPARSYNTYIPYGLRKAFGLPTFEDQDAIYAYHFKRSLQRAKNVYLLYDTEVDSFGGGEKSRFILQMLYSIEKAENSKIQVDDFHLSLPVSSQAKAKKPIQVEKTPEVMELLKRYLATNETSDYSLSATALIAYVDDPFKFYLRYIAGLEEKEEYNQDFDAREFGKIVHRGLEEFYKPFEGKQVEAEEIEKMMSPSAINEMVEQALVMEEILREGQVIEGKNLLFESVIKKLMEKVLEADLAIAPFEIVALETQSLENTIEVDGMQVRLGGIVDRIDRVDGSVRIIDYKTGRVDFLPPTKASEVNYEQYLSNYFTDSKYKSGFQAYYYAYLYHKQHPQDQIKAGVFGLKEVNRGVRLLREGHTIPFELIAAFEKRLKALIREIFDPNIPFSAKEE
ncbi:MAG: PD-(D/E)XK nuclease family protein [Bacteroidota bacterium]